MLVSELVNELAKYSDLFIDFSIFDPYSGNLIKCLEPAIVDGKYLFEVRNDKQELTGVVVLALREELE